MNVIEIVKSGLVIVHEATEDTTCAGSAGHYLPSQDWTIVFEDPSREALLEFLGEGR